MCTYISLITSPDADLRTVADCARRAGFRSRWAPAENASLQRQLPGKLIHCGAHVGAPESGCDCGTALVKCHAAEKAAREPSEGQIRKMRRRGWTAARFERWHAQVTAETPVEGLRALELERWIAFLTELARDSTVRPVGLLVHEYAGDLEVESIPIRARHNLELATLTAALDAGLEPDAYYEIVAGARD